MWATDFDVRPRERDVVFQSRARRAETGGRPSTVLGLLFHLTEHAQRHTGQAIATAKAARGPYGRAIRRRSSAACAGQKRGPLRSVSASEFENHMTQPRSSQWASP